MIQPGTLIGDRYQIESLIDEGGMARVFRVKDTKLNRIVALKIIRQESFSPYVMQEVFGRFELEATSLAKLSHPNIVQIIDFGKYEGTPYVVMPYIVGGTLKKFQGQPLTIERAARLLLPITRALSYAHSHGFIHRDVKPSNILLTDSDEPMLSDFGLVKEINSNLAQALTATGASIGTPEYMAPEQAMGDKIDGRADIFSLGVVLYELVTGKRPFYADTPMAIVLKQATEPLPDPRVSNPNLSELAAGVLRKALASKPDERYQTMGEFETALDELRGVPSRAAPSAPPPAYDVERTMITPSKAVSFPKPQAPATPPPPPAVVNGENNATVQMKPIKAPSVPPPPGAVENMPTMQMSKPVTQPREQAPPQNMMDMPTMQMGPQGGQMRPQTPPPGMQDMPTMQMGVSPVRPGMPPPSTPSNFGEMPTMAVPAYQPPAPAELGNVTPETSRVGSKTALFALLGGGIVLLLLVGFGGWWVYNTFFKPAAVPDISKTAEAAATQAAAATAAPTALPTANPNLKPLEDFEGAQLTKGLAGGVEVGWVTWSSGIPVTLSLTQAQGDQALPGQTGANTVLKLETSADGEGWVGFTHSFTNAGASLWVPQNWSSHSGISMWIWGNGTGGQMIITLLENRTANSTIDDAERWSVYFNDDFNGWKFFEFSFSDFRRVDIGNGAPNDGLYLTEVNGYAVGAQFSAGVGPHFLYIDDVKLFKKGP